MTLADFVAAHDGQYLDFDGVYGAQCVDLVEFYLRDVCGIPPLAGNAIDEFGEESDRLEWVTNDAADPNQLPPRGAVVIWGQSYQVGTGVLGHTAVCLDAGPAGFHSFDQNWPVGAPCHVQGHIYPGVIGWGIPKGVDMPFDDGDKLELARIYAAMFYPPSGADPQGFQPYVKLFEAKLKAAAAQVIQGSLTADQARELQEAHDAVAKIEAALKQA